MSTSLDWSGFIAFLDELDYWTIYNIYRQACKKIYNS